MAKDDFDKDFHFDDDDFDPKAFLDGEDGADIDLSEFDDVPSGSVPLSNGRSIGSICLSFASSTARSITFCSSRTLPGHA